MSAELLPEAAPSAPVAASVTFTMPETARYLKAMFDGASEYIGLLTPDGAILHTNRISLEAIGAKLEDVVGRPFWETPWWTESPANQARLREAVATAAGGEPVRFEFQRRGRDGETITLDFLLTPVRDESGKVILLVPEGRDITQRREAEQALQQILARLKAVLESALDPVVTIDRYGVVQSVSRSIERVFGYRPDEVVGKNVSMLMPSPHRGAHDGYLAKYRRTGQTNILGRTREFQAVRKDGTVFPIELSVSRVEVPGESGDNLFTGIIHDVSERRQTEEQLRQTEALLSGVIENATSVVFAKDLQGRYTLVNKRFQTLWGIPKEQLVGKTAVELFPPTLAADIAASDRAALESGEPIETEEVIDFSDGPHVFMSSKASLIGSDGKPYGLCGISTDITERKRAEQEVRLLQTISLSISEARSLSDALTTTLRVICESTGWDYGEVWLPAPDGATLVASQSWVKPGPHSPAMETLATSSALSVIKPGTSVAGRVYQEKRTIWYPDLAQLPATQFPRTQMAIKAGATAGGGIPITLANEVVAVLLFFVHRSRAQDSRLLKLVASAVAPLGNAIQRKRAENELDKYRQQLETLVAERTSQLQVTHEQLRSADRLASIGTLAAGLGHDMNNVLLPIRCRLDAMDATNLAKDIQDHFAAVRKSVSYLQQLSDGLHLLALDPSEDGASGETTDIQDWWEQVGPLLRRAAPKHADFSVVISEGLPRVTVAPHRLTQAILNLVVNAGEAIPKSGGKIKLWAKKSGRSQVQIAVTDNGHGMSEEVRRRALDPFFTTKKRGLGTGLGLALVHGVSQTAGGDVLIESEPGKGATVIMRLPCAQEANKRGRAAPTAAVSLQDERIASFVCTFLRSAGVEPTRMKADRAPGAHTCWVTDPTPDALATAKSFLKAKKGRCVVAIGATGTELSQWRRAGAVILEGVADFENFRRVMGKAIAAATGNGT
jgi:PAS domain S-box-containing protein